MNTDDLFNPLFGLDYNILNDPEFGEDSVREEIITPVLKALGYAASGDNKIIRSRKLVHPFVSIGSARKEIHLIPDYLLEVLGNKAWILEAKAPNENITKSAHVEQAYSYAIHSEIRVKYFVLCNGREFALFGMGEPELLLLHFPIQALPRYWDTLKNRLSPETVFESSGKMAKDLGLHLKRLGFEKFSILLNNVLAPHLARLGTDHFTFASSTTLEGETYCASFDFNLSVAVTLSGLIPKEAYDWLLKPYTGKIEKIVFAEINIYLSVQVSIGDKLEENKREIFLPLTVEKFLPAE